MTDHRDPDRLIHEFVLEGAEELHDQVYDAVRADIEHRRQRAVIGPWRMPDIMNKLVPIGLGTAAVVGALVIGTQFLGAPAPGGAGGGPTAEPSATPEPSASVAAPSASPAADLPVGSSHGAAPTASPHFSPERIPKSGPIDAGTYLVSDGRSTIHVTFPAGWEPSWNNSFRKGIDQPAVTFQVSKYNMSVWPDACDTEAFPPPTGPTAEDLVGALRAQQRSNVSEPAEISIGGLPGVRVEVSIPDGLDMTRCTNDVLRIWSDSRARDDFLFFEGPGPYLVYITEAPSGRIVLTTSSAPEATAADLAELQVILDSIQIEPAPAGAGASPTGEPSAAP